MVSIIADDTNLDHNERLITIVVMMTVIIKVHSNDQFLLQMLVGSFCRVKPNFVIYHSMVGLQDKILEYDWQISHLANVHIALLY